VKLWRIVPIRSQRAGIEHSPAFRRWAFSFCEGLLDRIEIGGIGRKQPQHRACGLDGLAHASHLVGGEIVHRAGSVILVMLVEVPVSSMKTNLLGSSRGFSCFQFARAAGSAGPRMHRQL
jgi:hypothetical protein